MKIAATSQVCSNNKSNCVVEAFSRVLNRYTQWIVGAIISLSIGESNIELEVELNYFSSLFITLGPYDSIVLFHTF